MTCPPIAEILAWAPPGAVERRGMQLDILAAFLRIVAAAATRNRILVACGAADRVEQRPQPRLRRELGREDGAAHIEPQSLRGREAWQRSAEHGHGRREFRRRQRAWWGRGDGGHRRRCAFIASGDTDQHGYEQRIPTCATHEALPGKRGEGADHLRPPRYFRAGHMGFVRDGPHWEIVLSCA